MSSKIISAAVLSIAALTSVSSFASSDSQSFVDQPTVQSTTTRADVNAELQQAKRAGYVAMPTNHSYPGTVATVQGKGLSRAEVRASAETGRMPVYN